MNREKVFTDFYEKNFDKLLRYLDYNFPNLHDSESQLQDTFIKFYELYYEGWNPSQSELMTYFMNYLKMTTLNTIKQNQKNKPVSLDVEYEVGSKIVTLKDILIQDDTTNSIDDKLNILNIIIKGLEKKWIERFDLLLLHYKGMSYEQISKEKSIPLSQVKNHIRLIRIYFCEEYSKLTNKKMEYKKESQKDSFISSEKIRIKNIEIRKKKKLI
jgi:DNA-directed RNA polymerase specialized sigma24 family protein